MHVVLCCAELIPRPWKRSLGVIITKKLRLNCAGLWVSLDDIVTGNDKHHRYLPTFLFPL